MEKEKEKENFKFPKYNKKILLYYSSHATTYLCWVCYLLETKPIENIKSDVFFPSVFSHKMEYYGTFWFDISWCWFFWCMLLVLFRDLDDELQESLYEFLETRGIDDDLAIFVHEYMKNKDKTEFIRWMGTVKSFIEQK